ncbi:MAG: hypothetical protein K9G61_07120 [Bacteroidales bacterium]|nr:hypothetical protein [Bacteroidales bacterium]
MMRSKLLFLALFIPFITFGQVEVVPYAGYMFGGGVQFLQGDLKIRDGVNYGASVIIPDVKYATDLEISYTRLDSKAVFTAYPAYSSYDDDEVNISTNYFQIGIMKAFNETGNFIPFGSFSAGATVFSPKTSQYSDTWRFSVALGLGVKMMFDERVGIMVRGRLLLPMNFGGVGGYYGFGTGGSGGGLYVNSYATIVQGDFTAGLILKIGK